MPTLSRDCEVSLRAHFHGVRHVPFPIRRAWGMARPFVGSRCGFDVTSPIGFGLNEGMPVVAVLFGVGLVGLALGTIRSVWVKRADTDRAGPLYTIAAALLLLGIVAVTATIATAAPPLVTGSLAVVLYGGAACFGVAGMVAAVQESRAGYRRQQELHPGKKVHWWWPQSLVIITWIVGILVGVYAFVFGFVFVIDRLVAFDVLHELDDSVYTGVTFGVIATMFVAITVGGVYVWFIRPRRIRRAEAELTAD